MDKKNKEKTLLQKTLKTMLYTTYLQETHIIIDGSGIIIRIFEFGNTLVLFHT